MKTAEPDAPTAAGRQSVSPVDMAQPLTCGSGPRPAIADRAAGHPVGTSPSRVNPLYRSVFVSDVHLGARNARADLLLEFLNRHPAETLYLVGDITDNWIRLGRSWRQEHHGVLLRFLDLARSGTNIIYTPGNHDAFFAHYVGIGVGGVRVAPECVHTAPDGRRYLVTHGDCCDIFASRAPVLARIGGAMEGVARLVDEGQRAMSRRLGAKQEWTGIDRAIERINEEIRKHDRFEDRLVNMARGRGFDGIICGHFHQPALRGRDGIIYANCGDWTGNNTAIVEDFDGSLRLLAWDGSSVETSADEDDIFDLAFPLGRG